MKDLVPNFDYGLIGFILVACSVYIGMYLRAMLPAWKEQGVAKSRKIDAEASSIEQSKENGIKLVSLIDRNTNMLDATTRGIAELAHVASDTQHVAKRVYEHLMRGCQCEEDRAENSKGA